MSRTRNALAGAAITLGILLLIPIVGDIFAPTRTSEMMGGRMMVWGFLWAFLVFVAILVLVVLLGVRVWQRVHSRWLR